MIPVSPTAAVVLGLLVLGAFDVWRHEIEDTATAALLLAAVAILAAQGTTQIQWADGILAAGIAFTVYLALGIRGVVGGGDVKLSIVPALVLGVRSPLLGIWWIAAALAVHQLFLIAAFGRTHRRLRTVAGGTAVPVAALPHVPAMAAAMILASTLFPAA